MPRSSVEPELGANVMDHWERQRPFLSASQSAVTSQCSPLLEYLPEVLGLELMVFYTGGERDGRALGFAKHTGHTMFVMVLGVGRQLCFQR